MEPYFELTQRSYRNHRAVTSRFVKFEAFSKCGWPRKRYHIKEHIDLLAAVQIGFVLIDLLEKV
jgi:hypothetical protein